MAPRSLRRLDLVARHLRQAQHHREQREGQVDVEQARPGSRTACSGSCRHRQPNSASQAAGQDAAARHQKQKGAEQAHAFGDEDRHRDQHRRRSVAKRRDRRTSALAIGHAISTQRNRGGAGEAERPGERAPVALAHRGDVVREGRVAGRARRCAAASGWSRRRRPAAAAKPSSSSNAVGSIAIEAGARLAAHGSFRRPRRHRRGRSRAAWSPGRGHGVPRRQLRDEGLVAAARVELRARAEDIVVEHDRPRTRRRPCRRAASTRSRSGPQHHPAGAGGSGGGSGIVEASSGARQPLPLQLQPDHVHLAHELGDEARSRAGDRSPTARRAARSRPARMTAIRSLITIASSRLWVM